MENELVDVPSHLPLRQVTAAKGLEEAYLYIYGNTIARKSGNIPFAN